MKYKPVSGIQMLCATQIDEAILVDYKYLTMEGLLETYCNYHPEFYSTLEPFTRDIKEHIINNLENAKNESQFRSTIAELQFGLKFQNLGFILDYEKSTLTSKHLIGLFLKTGLAQFVKFID